MLQADQMRIRSVLTESLVLLCKSALSYKNEFCVEGLLGITIDNADVLLVNIKETVTGALFNETTRQTCDELSQSFPFTFLCKDDGIKVDPETILIDGCTELEIPCSAALLGVAEPKTVRNEEALNSGIVDIAGAYVKYEGFDDDDDEPHSTLLTCIELDELIQKDVKMKDLPFESCDQSGYDGDAVLKRENLLMTSYDSNESQMETVSVLMNHSTDIMLQNAKDIEQTASGSEWDEVTEEEMAPLNLAGPQDLSTGVGKQTYICSSCGKSYKTETRLQEHDCETAIDSDESLILGDMPEPLNLKSQPLDLTTGRTDGDLCMYADLDGFTCRCSRSYPDYQSYVDHSTVCTKAKLTPYKSCEICGKFLFSNSGYAKHKKLHVGEYKFRCSICHKGFFDKTHLRAHTDSSHSKVRRHACPCCKKSFFWKHHLKRHRQTCSKDQMVASSAVGGELEDIESSSSEVIGLDLQGDVELPDCAI